MSKSSFFDIFPPPSFMTMPAFGLSFEGDVFRMVSFKKKHHDLILESAKEFKIDPSAFNSGEISKPDKILEVLKKISDVADTKFVNFVLPEDHAYVYEAVVPLPEEGEVDEAVEFSLDQNIPLSAAEAVSDFSIIEGPFTHQDVKSVRVAVSAYSRNLAEAWVEMLNQSGLVPISMTSGAQALSKSVVAEGDRRPVLLAHILNDKAIIAIVADGFVRFATTVAVNDENVSKALESSAGQRITESVELLAIRDELKKVASYWMSKEGIKSKSEPRSIKSVILTGRMSGMSEVAEYLAKHLGVPVTLGDVWRNAFSTEFFVPEISFDDSLGYAIAAGAALPSK